MSTRKVAAAPLAVLVGVAALVAGCGWSGPADAEMLGQRAIALLEELEAQPLESDTFILYDTDVKFDGPSVSAHGLRVDRDLEHTLVDLAASLGDDGFDIVLDEPVDYSLGHEVLATDGHLVIRCLLGAGSDDFAMYPLRDQGSYVVVTVANIRSGPAWTEVDR